MSNVAKFEFEGDAVYSPFSGKRASTERGPNTRDKTLLFIYYGDSGEYGFISGRVMRALGKDQDSVRRLSPASLLKKTLLPGRMALEVDTGWNGVNFYAFAP